MTAQRRLRILVLCGCLLLVARPAAAHWLTWLDELSGPGPYTASRHMVLAGEIRCVGTLSPQHKLIILKELETLTVRAVEASKTLRTMKEIEEQQRQDREAINRSLRRAGSRNCENDRGNALISFVVEFGSWDDQPEGRYVGDTKLRSYEVIAYFPLHRILGAEEPNRFTRAVEIGAGIGAFRLHGGTIRERDWWRGSIAIRSRIIPAELFPGIENVPRRWRKALQSVQYRIGGDWLPGQFDRTAFNDQDFEGSTDFVATRGVQIDLGTLACAFLPCR